MTFDFNDVPEVVAALDAAKARGHRFISEPYVRGYEGDLRTTFKCSRCGDLVIIIAQRGRPLAINGAAASLGRCHADRKGGSR